MKRKRFFRRMRSVILLIIVIIYCAVPAYAAQEHPAEELTVGVPGDRCPIFYSDKESGEMIGIGIDMMRYAAESAGFQVNFRTIEETTLKEALDNPVYDIVMPFGSAITSASGKSIIVSDNLMQTPFILVTADRHQLPELNHIRVGMLRSLVGGAETVRQLYPGIEINIYETMDECVNALRADKVDALLHNSYVWSYILQKPAYADLIAQPSTMFTMDFRVGTPDTPKGRQLIERLNQGIASLSDTRRQAIILDYTSRRLYQYDFWDYLYQYWLIILLILLLFVSVAIIAFQRVRSVRRKQEKKILEIIDQDPLTGVLSMEGFRKRATKLLKEHPDIHYLIAYANIKNFKYINDSLGRQAGDQLLRFWADETVKTLNDAEAMGRIESDRFVILRQMGGEEKIKQDDEGVINLVRSYFIDRGLENRVQICGGVYVLTPEDYQLPDIDHMLDLARVAEKRVRISKKDGYEFYNPEQWNKGKRTVSIISHLHAALRNGEIQVWYQPKVNFETGKLIGAEALCRWNHSQLGWISPGEFIPTLEEAGLIRELDYFVWDKVCQDIQRWERQGIHRYVSVNLSRCDIKEDADISEHFCELIKTYGLTPDKLSIEITETVYVESADVMITTADKLRKQGFKVEMDDFGSGYSSLNMLKEVPLDRIKLDLHFLTQSGDMEKCRTIIRCVVEMVRSLGMELLAEGVETLEQAEFLRSIGCIEMQGYYFYKPMPVSDLEHIKT